MTTPTRPRLTRAQAFAALRITGWPTGAFRTNLGLSVPFDVLAVAIAEAESDLYVDAQGPPNRDGTVDRGWLQINSLHGYDPALLRNDPIYTAQAALQILLQQGVRAWAAYGVKASSGTYAGQYPYARRMPPGLGGPDLAVGARGPLVVTVQEFLNAEKAKASSGLTFPTLVADGAYGPRTQTAVDAWKAKHHRDNLKPITRQTWARMALVGGIR